MKKRCIPFILTAVFLLATMGTVLAEGGEVITFKGEAEKFVHLPEKPLVGNGVAFLFDLLCWWFQRVSDRGF